MQNEEQAFAKGLGGHTEPLNQGCAMAAGAGLVGMGPAIGHYAERISAEPQRLNGDPLAVVNEATGRTTIYWKRHGGLSDAGINVLLASFKTAAMQRDQASAMLQQANAITRAAIRVQDDVREALEKLGYDLSDEA